MENMKVRMTNSELLKEYYKNQKRGMIATEMCKRAGTQQFLFKYCTPGELDADKRFDSCMRDTISVLLKKAEKRY